MNGIPQRRRRFLVVFVMLLLWARTSDNSALVAAAEGGLLGLGLTFGTMGLLHVVSLIWPRTRPWFFRPQGEASP